MNLISCTTPNLITFLSSEGGDGYSEVLSVDRKTLHAGVKGSRDYTCELTKIDTSENLL